MNTEDISRVTIHPAASDPAGFLTYNGALTAVSPALLGWYVWRVLGSGKSRDGWSERLGLPGEGQKSIRPGNNVWFHAVSVGETVVAAPIVRQFQTLEPDVDIALSNITATGRQMAAKLLPQAHAFYLPVDILPSVRAVFSRVRPLCLAVCEAEIWPNLLHQAKLAGAGVVLVNGRVSDSTVQRARKIGKIYRWALSNIDCFMMQSQVDAERIISLGADRTRVWAAGNTKFDEADRPLSDQETSALALTYGLTGNEAVFVAGSTNPGEDEPVLDAFVSTREVQKNSRLIIAPRQIERADEIEALACQRGLSAIKKSDITEKHDADVIILNTFGELASVYALARAAFVGGTLIDKGGHNILQPLAQGVPVIFGPYDYKITDIAGRASEAGVAFRVNSAQELADCLNKLMASGKNDYKKRALEFIDASRGASLLCAQIIQSLASQARSRKG